MRSLVYTEDLKLNDVTDENGLCTIQLTPGSYEFTIKYTSYQTILLIIDKKLIDVLIVFNTYSLISSAISSC